MILTTHDLSKRIWFREVLSDINLHLEPGSIVALLGANGTGKTTLMRVLGCIYTPSEGDVRIDGQVLNRQRLDLRKRLRLVADQNINKLPLTVVEYLVFAASLYGKTPTEIRERSLGLLEQWGVQELHWQLMGNLSRGQAYKVEMACLELCDPELWMLDEPFASGMDAPGLEQLRRSMTEAKARNRTIIFSTQIASLARQLCDWVLLMDHSNIVYSGKSEAIDSVVTQGRPAVEAIVAAFREADRVLES